MHSTPKVSIGLPVYNGEAYVAKAIASILAQTLTDLELVICDNASTDRTEEICREFARQDSRVRYHRNEKNIGSWRNHNLSLELSRSVSYFRIASHDDWMEPTYLEKAVALLEQHPHAVMCYAKTRMVDSQEREISLEQQLEGMRNGFLVDSAGQVLLPPVAEPAYKGLDDPDPATRFHRALFRMTMCHEIYGVVRMSTVRAQPFLLGFFGSDKVALVNWSLAGPWMMVDEYLMNNRRHSTQSGNIVSAAERESWNDPTVRARRIAAFEARWQCFCGYARAVFGARLGAVATVKCLLSLGLFSLKTRSWRQVFNEITGRKARQLAKRSAEERSPGRPASRSHEVDPRPKHS